MSREMIFLSLFSALLPFAFRELADGDSQGPSPQSDRDPDSPLSRKMALNNADQLLCFLPFGEGFERLYLSFPFFLGHFIFSFSSAGHGPF